MVQYNIKCVRSHLMWCHDTGLPVTTVFKEYKALSSRVKGSNTDSQACQTDEDVKVWRPVGEGYKRLAGQVGGHVGMTGYMCRSRKGKVKFTLEQTMKAQGGADV